MKVERLSSGPGGLAYHAMHTADRLSRYCLLSESCRGKRVLDIACGEGDGSRLLAEWGASSIVGIDVSADAISRARGRLAEKRIAFQVGDVCDPECLQGQAHTFDIICHFGNIESVKSPAALLESISRLRGPETLVAVSAPNFPEDKNARTRLTFESFVKAGEAALGPATRWYLGVPLQGHQLIEDEGSASAGAGPAVKHKDTSVLQLIPPQDNSAVSADDAVFWLGVWGETVDNFGVESTVSMKRQAAPWQMIARLEREKELLERDNRRLENILAEERHAALFVRQRLDRAEREVNLTSETVHAIAMEVWYEHQRWGLPYKVMSRLRKILGDRPK